MKYEQHRDVKSRIRHEIDDELTFHLEGEIDALVEAGATREQAIRTVMDRAGDLDSVRAACAELDRQRSRRRSLMDVLGSLQQDLAYSVRTFRKKPRFTLVALATLALGMGPATTIYSVVDTVLWRPLPYEASDELVRLSGSFPNGGRGPVPGPMFSDWAREGEAFHDLTAVMVESLDLSSPDGPPQRLRGGAVSAGFADLFRVQPVRGRWFTPEEDRSASAPVVVLSHHVWRDRWGGDPAVLNKPVTLSGRAFMVIGVMPADFVPPEGVGLKDIDAWIPLAHSTSEITTHDNWFLRVVARMSTGTSLDAETERLQTLTDQLIASYPAESYADGYRVQVGRLQEITSEASGSTLYPLLAAAVLLLLIACVNVANLSVARGHDRRAEIALRRALGATRGRLIRLFVMENLLLTAVGGALGLLVAAGGIGLFQTLAPNDIPRIAEISLDHRVLLAALATISVTGLVFGIIPGAQAADPNVAQAIQAGRMGVTSDRGQHRLRSLLVVSETALALVVLSGAGLLANSFIRLAQVPVGFEADGVSVAHISLGTEYADQASRVAFFEEARERLAAVPGIERVGLANGLPFSEGGAAGSVRIEGAPDGGEVPGFYRWQLVDAGFFETLRIAALPGGRVLEPGDIRGRTPVVVVNEAFARTHWPEGSAVGKYMKIVRTGDDDPWLEVVGVVPDFKQGRLDREVQPEAYVAFTFPPFIFARMDFVLRSPVTVPLRSIQQAIWDVDGDQPIAWVATLEERIGQSLTRPRFYMLLLVGFGAAAVLLAAVGVYGSITHAVGQRTREFGIRLALGATVFGLRAQVLRSGMAWMATGVGLGLLGAYGFGRALESFLFEVSPMDPTTLGLSSALLVLVGLAAAYGPARRATRVDPVAALRE